MCRFDNGAAIVRDQLGYQSRTPYIRMNTIPKWHHIITRPHISKYIQLYIQLCINIQQAELRKRSDSLEPGACEP